MEEKNPFSIYDFLGYFFPGSLALYLIFIISKKGICDVAPIKYLEFIKDFITEDAIKIDIVKGVIPFIILAYILGHIISYASSLTIEYMTNNAFGYPSDYLLSVGREEDAWTAYWHHGYKSYERKQRVIRYYEWINFIINLWNRTIINKLRFFAAYRGRSLLLIWRIFIYFLLLPVSILLISKYRISKAIVKFITRPLPTYIINCIESKLFNLSEQLGVDRPPINLQCDYHRIVMHFVYINYPTCQKKIDNYVALYGFLRSITLILCIFTDLLLFLAIKSINIHSKFDKTSILLILFVWISSILSCLAYVKFYRRFTLENYMSLLSGNKQNSHLSNENTTL